MRTWLLAVAALTLVALTSPITAGEKRSSALAVRVTVSRSCSVNTDAALQTGGGVTCGSRFGPPVMSTSSTIAVPVPVVPPAAVVESNAPEREQAVEGREAEPARRSEPAVERTSESATALPVDAASGSQPETMAIRVVTVNF